MSPRVRLNDWEGRAKLPADPRWGIKPIVVMLNGRSGFPKTERHPVRRG